MDSKFYRNSLLDRFSLYGSCLNQIKSGGTVVPEKTHYQWQKASRDQLQTPPTSWASRRVPAGGQNRVCKIDVGWSILEGYN